MKLFLSWSGSTSEKVALALRDWLPKVIQALQPYVSSEDIEKGMRWSTDISKELESSSFGILCVTKANVGAPWLNFEAGALSKAVDKSRVSPFLFGVKRSDVQGPLLQFQSTIYEEADVRKLIQSLNNALPAPGQLDDAALSEIFDVWWPRLKLKLDPLLAEASSTPPPSTAAPTRSSQQILEEMLDLLRNQQKILSDPQVLLPPHYLAQAIGISGSSSDAAYSDAIQLFHAYTMELRSKLSEIPEATQVPRELVADFLERSEELLARIPPPRQIRRHGAWRPLPRTFSELDVSWTRI